MGTFLKIIGGLFVLLLALIAFFPMILSTQFGTSFLTQQINQRIPGHLDIQDVQLSWLSGQKLGNITLESSRGTPILHIDEVTSDRSLLSLFTTPQSSPLPWGNVRLIGLKGSLLQDARGVSNLEDALGLKAIQEDARLSFVEVENVNAEIKQDSDQDLKAKAVGLTRQNNVKGQFQLDFQWGKTKTMHLSAEQFPILVLDQLFTLRYPDMSGVLQNAIGDSFNVTIDQSISGENTLWHVIAKSPLMQADIKAETQPDKILVQSGSRLHFNIPEQQAKRLIEILDADIPFPQQPFSGEFTIDGLQIPLRNWEEWTGKAALKIHPNAFQLKGENTLINLSQLNIALEAPSNSKDLSIDIQGQAEQQGKPILLNMQLKVDKSPFGRGDIEMLFRTGIRTQGSLESQQNIILASQMSSLAKIQWDGIVREKETHMQCNLDTESIKLTDVSLQIDDLPVREWLETGHFRKPLQVAFAEKHNDAERIKGHLRIDLSENANYPDIQMDLALRGFPTHMIQHLLPEHDLTSIIGEDIDADIAGRQNGIGDIQGEWQIAALHHSLGFLKGFSGTFHLSNEKCDLAFEAKANQTQGSTEVAGCLNNLWDTEGRLRLDQASISLKGTLSHIPVALVTRLATGDQQLAEQMEAVLGVYADADISSEIAGRQGPLQTEVRGSNGQLFLKGKIQRGVLLLDQPLTAYVTVTPELERTVLSCLMPILGSVIKAEKPIELIIAKEGFHLPLNSLNLENLTIGQAELHLNRMWFSRDSQIGKVVSLLGINSNSFEVWFTPIYFSLQKEMLTMKRADMLIADTYPLASWGTLDFDRDRINFVMGISGQALKKAFAMKGVKNSYLLQVPVHGTIRKPQLDTSLAATRLSALVAQSQVGKGSKDKLMETLVETAQDLLESESAPLPTTNPLPWANTLQETPDATVASDSQDNIIEKPLKELKKGTRSLLKEILGK
jgi:hypothetical protein